MESPVDPARPAADPVARLAELGVERPAACTARRLLAVAAEVGLLPAAAVEHYLEVYEQAVHGGGGGDVVAARAPLVVALAAIGPSDPRLALVRAALQPPAVQPPTGVRARSLAVNRLEPEDEPVAESPPPAVTSARREAAAGRRRRRWVALAAGLGTLAVFAAGVLTGPAVTRGVRAAGARWLGWNVGDPARLEQLQRTAGERPDEDGVWATLVAEARRLERWDVVVLAMRHLVAVNPDDANLLNELAWLLLTGPEPWLRDPAQALELAERAFALDPSPNIIDTLAEAAYQTGDPLRAVSLEMIALSKVEGNHAFFDRQLAKFRAAAAERAEP